MSDTSRSPAGSREAFRLPDTDGSAEGPYEIVYARYTRDLGKPGAGVVASPTSYVICRTDVEAFVKERLRNVPLPPYKCRRRRHKEDPHGRPPAPIDIYVGCNCYVVIELDSALPWQFARDRPGVTTASDYGASNSDLKHVKPDGELAGGDGPGVDGCRIVYFRVNDRRDFQHQQFHLNVSSGENLRDETIDPDIPNDGGDFPMFPRSPCLGTQECAVDEDG